MQRDQRQGGQEAGDDGAGRVVRPRRAAGEQPRQQRRRDQRDGGALVLGAEVAGARGGRGNRRARTRGDHDPGGEVRAPRQDTSGPAGGVARAAASSGAWSVRAPRGRRGGGPASGVFVDISTSAWARGRRTVSRLGLTCPCLTRRPGSTRPSGPGRPATFEHVQNAPTGPPLRVVAVTYSPGESLEGFVRSLATATTRPDRGRARRQRVHRRRPGGRRGGAPARAAAAHRRQRRLRRRGQRRDGRA